MTETTKKPVTNIKSPRWVKVLLVLSLAFNLLILGAVASKAFMPHPRFGGKGMAKIHHTPLARPAALIRTGRHMIRTMPGERRMEMFRLVRKHLVNMHDDRKKLAATRLALAKLVAAPSFDKTAFEAAYKAEKQAEAVIHEKTGALTRDFIENLTPAERKQYAEILQNPPRRRWFGRH